MQRTRVEFTIEPFQEGTLGPHVQAALDVARTFDTALEIGPFATTATVPATDAAVLAHDIVRAALAGGASRVAIQVEALG